MSSLWLTLLSAMLVNLLLPRRHSLAAGNLLLRRVAHLPRRNRTVLAAGASL